MRDEALPFYGMAKISPTIWTVQGFGLVLLTFLSFFPRLSHPAEYLFIGLFVIACATAWLEGSELWIRTPIDVPLLLFVAWVLLSLPFATDLTYSFAEWRKLVVKVLVFYWALLVLRKDPNGTTTGQVLAAVVVGATLVSAYALSEFFSSGGSWRDRHVRASAPSSDYNWLSTYLIIAIPILVTAALWARDRRQRLVCGWALGLALLGQVFSYTRAGWLGLVAEGIAFGLFTGRRKVAVGVLLASLAVGASFLVVSKVGYQQVTVSSETWEYRLALWEKGIVEIVAHPLFGVGYGNETFVKRFGGHPVMGGPAALHSLFLMVTLGSGIPALILLVWALMAAVRSLVTCARGTADAHRLALMIGVAVMITGFAVRNLFDYMFAGAVAHLFWILAAAGLHQVAVLRPTRRRAEGLSAA